MGFMVSLQHVRRLADGRYRYRRRFPQEVRAKLGWEFINTSDSPLSEKALLSWFQQREAEFEAKVAARRGLAVAEDATEVDLFKAARAKAREMLGGIVGIDEDDARAVLAENIAAGYPEDPETGDAWGMKRADAALIKALMAPNAPSPEPKFADVKKLYLDEKVGDADSAPFHGVRTPTFGKTRVLIRTPRRAA